MYCSNIAKQNTITKISKAIIAFFVIALLIAPKSGNAITSGWFNIETAKANSLDKNKLAIVDFNGDGFVNILDLVFISKNYGKGLSGDVNQDGFTDQKDIDICTKYFGYKSDTYAPETAITFSDDIKNGWTNKASVKLSLTSTDKGSGVDKTYYLVSKNDEAKPDLIPNNEYKLEGIEIKGDGEYKLLYRSTDKAGNEEIIKTLEFVMDTTPPSISGTNLPSGWINAQSTIDSITLKVTDTGGSGLKNVLFYYGPEENGKPNTVYNGSIPISKTDGIGHLNVQAVDNFGNTSEIVKFQVPVDRTDPVLNTPALPQFSNKPLEVRLEAEDNLSGVAGILFGKGPNQSTAPTNNYTGPVIVDGEGNWYIPVRITDNAGNVSDSLLKTTIDQTKPVINYQVVGAGSDYIKLKVNKVDDANPDQSKNAIVFDGRDQQSFTEGKEMVFTGLQPGVSYSALLIAMDKAGNETRMPINVKTVDAAGNCYVLLAQGVGITSAMPFYDYLVNTLGYKGTAIIAPKSVDEIIKAADAIKAKTTPNDTVIYALNFDNEEGNPGNYLLYYGTDGKGVGTTKEEATKLANVFAGDNCKYILVFPETCYSKDIDNKIDESLHLPLLVVFGPCAIDEKDTKAFLLGAKYVHETQKDPTLLEFFNTIYPSYIKSKDNPQHPFLNIYKDGNIIAASTKEGTFKFSDAIGSELIKMPLFPRPGF